MKMKKKMKRYRNAANQGDAKAQFMLGECYYYGKGVNEDKDKAMEWYTKAADQGHSGAISKLLSSFM